MVTMFLPRPPVTDKSVGILPTEEPELNVPAFGNTGNFSVIGNHRKVTGIAKWLQFFLPSSSTSFLLRRYTCKT